MVRCALFSVLLVAIGCSTNTSVVFEEDARVKERLLSAGSPMPLKLAVGPVRMGFDRETFNRKNAEENHYAPLAKGEALRDNLVDGLKKLSCFQEIVYVGEEGQDMGELLEDAWEKKCDVLLDLTLKRFEVYWVGNNWGYIPNMLYWLFFWVMSSFVPDEVFGGAIDLQADLYSVHSNRKLNSWHVSSDVERDLDDFERGWMLLGFLRVPGALDEENWLQVADVVNPYTLLETKIGLVESVQELRPMLGTPAFSKKMSKRMALVVGIDRWKDYGFKRVRFAADDAKAFAGALSDRMGVPEKNLRLLTDEQATRENVRKAVEDFLVERSTENDTVFIYYAGYGYLSKNQREEGGEGAYEGPSRYLMTFDAAYEKPEETGLALSELRGWLSHLKAANVVVVLDTAFNGPEEMRCLTGRRGDRVDVPGDFLSDFTGKGRFVLAAAPADQAAQPFQPKGHGMFTYFLLQGLDAALAADENKDGRVTVAETHAFARKKVSAQTQLSMHPQVPVLYGDGADEVGLIAPDIDAAGHAASEDSTAPRGENPSGKNAASSDTEGQGKTEEPAEKAGGAGTADGSKVGED